VLCALWIGSKSRMPVDEPGTMKLQEFAKLPVVYKGRIKPMDTIARNSLIEISDKQSFRESQRTGNHDLKSRENVKHPALEWYLDTITTHPAAFSNQVFRIPNSQVIDMLGLDPDRKRFRYAFSEFEPKLQMVDENANRAMQLEPGERDVFDSQILDLAQRVHLFVRLLESHRFITAKDMDAMHAMINRYQSLKNNPLPHVIPAYGAKDWETFTWSGVLRMTEEENPFYVPMGTMLYAYGIGDVEAFNNALVDYQAALKKSPPPQAFTQINDTKLNYELRFNHLSPFYTCSTLYVLAFLISCFAMLFAPKLLNRTTFYLLLLAFAFHTWALASRIYISGYPPVTNLYSSAIFIGWGCVGLGIILEAIFKLGVGNLLAAVAGFLTLLIAHFLSLDGDTMQVMQAVLDTKFWLATHVTTVTLGYTATYFAGGLGVIYVLFGVFGKRMDLSLERNLSRMIYGIICFALLLSFTGTVLGGLWADDSWGRFWGWDPKENGALIIVMWNALILHARWGAMVQSRGIAVMAIFGNIVTSWSWFGVNQLGIGLHSYGFTNSAAFWLIVFAASQLCIMGIGLVPRSMWRSTRQNPQLAGV
jgi:ABC-type transport system involved in cytochrome c biogenesis permease subunit